MNPIKTKAQIRDEISQEVNAFLANGGRVNNVPSGISGNDANTNLFSRSTSFEPKKDRTPVTDVIKELDERKKTPPPLKSRNSRPKKKLITDDFGEPVRWVWTED